MRPDHRTTPAAAPMYDDTDGVKGMRSLLERAPDLDGVFAASDAVAEVVWRASA